MIIHRLEGSCNNLGPVSKAVHTTAGLDIHCPIFCHIKSVKFSLEICVSAKKGECRIRFDLVSVSSAAVFWLRLCWYQHEANSRRRAPPKRAERRTATRAIAEHSDKFVASRTCLSTASSPLRYVLFAPPPTCLALLCCHNAQHDALGSFTHLSSVLPQTEWIGKDVKRKGTRVRLPSRALRRLLALLFLCGTNRLTLDGLLWNTICE